MIIVTVIFSFVIVSHVSVATSEKHIENIIGSRQLLWYKFNFAATNLDHCKLSNGIE